MVDEAKKDLVEMIQNTNNNLCRSSETLQEFSNMFSKLMSVEGQIDKLTRNLQQQKELSDKSKKMIDEIIDKKINEALNAGKNLKDDIQEIYNAVKEDKSINNFLTKKCFEYILESIDKKIDKKIKDSKTQIPPSFKI